MSNKSPTQPETPNIAKHSMVRWWRGHLLDGMWRSGVVGGTQSQCWQLFKELLGCLEINKSTNHRFFETSIYMAWIRFVTIVLVNPCKSYIIYSFGSLKNILWVVFSPELLNHEIPRPSGWIQNRFFLEFDQKWLVINHNTWHGVTTLRGNISPWKVVGKMIFLFHRIC